MRCTLPPVVDLTLAGSCIIVAAWTIVSSGCMRCGGAQACAWAIDELKATVPIWKKEVYEGGEVWKENAEARQAALGSSRPV